MNIHMSSKRLSIVSQIVGIVPVTVLEMFGTSVLASEAQKRSWLIRKAKMVVTLKYRLRTMKIIVPFRERI